VAAGVSVHTFWLEPTDEVAVGLRRYASRDRSDGFDCAHGYHSALRYTGRAPAQYEEHLDRRQRTRSAPDVPHDDPAWPTHCEHCSYEFVDDDHWQPWDELIYRRTDTGEDRVLHQGAPALELGIPAAEPGACWDAWWMPFSRGVDGIYLMVRLPDGHDWSVDSQAANCTRPGEPHKCWCRHGDPRECRVTVDKNGDTCNAGAGSIASPNWHGFLRNGQLVE
jgi:hypothetical protein